MGLIKEPLDIDFVVDPSPLTKAEEKAISDFIRADKEKRKQKEVGKRQLQNLNPNNLLDKRARTANSVFIKLWLDVKHSTINRYFASVVN
jgi:hypothetical protein